MDRSACLAITFRSYVLLFSLCCFEFWTKPTKSQFGNSFQIKNKNLLFLIVFISVKISVLVVRIHPSFQISAVANKGRGGGIENPAFYKDVHYSFLNIQNIHSMRASQTKLANACSMRSDSTNWFKSIQETKWLYHIQQILSAAAIVADRVSCIQLCLEGIS